ncbi:hypothetical protein PPACK8108_LOCUS17426 [Phakopsora pachyrhizi]|uniref:Uncharacterized protein n=1 Tax=Phakopsora pachyrhizi TaxID=170000 RepID=A0AAV0BBX8_PHAPC|nr:hypothetical protein PPACK8108_LOCUS17426 [Phakopsora pachyrhizi]
MGERRAVKEERTSGTRCAGWEKRPKPFQNFHLIQSSNSLQQRNAVRPPSWTIEDGTGVPEQSSAASSDLQPEEIECCMDISTSLSFVLMSTWPDAKTGAGLEVEAIGDEIVGKNVIERWVMRSRVTKVVRVGLGGGSAEFVDGKLGRARRLPRVKTRVARVITLGLPHAGPLPREVEEGVVEKIWVRNTELRGGME